MHPFILLKIGSIATEDRTEICAPMFLIASFMKIYVAFWTHTWLWTKVKCWFTSTTFKILLIQRWLCCSYNGIIELRNIQFLRDRKRFKLIIENVLNKPISSSWFVRKNTSPLYLNKTGTMMSMNCRVKLTPCSIVDKLEEDCEVIFRPPSVFNFSDIMITD